MSSGWTGLIGGKHRLPGICLQRESLKPSANPPSFHPSAPAPFETGTAPRTILLAEVVNQEDLGLLEAAGFLAFFWGLLRFIRGLYRVNRGV